MQNKWTKSVQVWLSCCLFWMEDPPPLEPQQSVMTVSFPASNKDSFCRNSELFLLVIKLPPSPPNILPLSPHTSLSSR